MEYSGTRFLSDCSKKVAKALRDAWSDGEQLATEAVPKEALPAVLILAAWGLRIDIEIVDDYDTLLDRTEQALKDGNVHHPDLFFASSIIIMARRGQELSLGGFELIGVPGIFIEFFGEQDEQD